jgi:hypothetical protein
LIAFAISFACSCGFAQATESDEFLPNKWSEGLHLFLGGGVNSTAYASSIKSSSLGLGSNFKTDLSYVLNDRWAVEWSSSVKFNQVDGYLLWDTLLTLGVRYRLRPLPGFDLDSSFVRFFVGRAPTVVFFRGGSQPDNQNVSVDRVQFDGPVAGIGFGAFRRMESGSTWFYEVAGSVQRLEQEDGIQLDGEVPVVAFHSVRTDGSTLYSLYAVIGLLIF